MADRPTPRLGHAPIVMRHRGRPPGDSGSVYDGFDLLERRGDFYWQVHPLNGRRRLVIALPCLRQRAEATGNGPFDWTHSHWTIDYPNANGAKWRWDGDRERPTLTPSLHAVGIWHGWVQAGTLKEA